MISSPKTFFLRFSCIVLICLICFSADLLEASDGKIGLGIVFSGNPVQTFKKWQPLAQYLSAHTGANIKVLPMDYDALVKWIKSNKPGIVICNLVIYSSFKNTPGLTAIAVPVWSVNGQPVYHYGAVIFSKRGGSIKSIADTAGKIFAIPHRYSLSALLGFKVLKDAGIKMSDISSVKVVKTHFNVVYGVINGAADVGIVRTGILEQMEAMKKVQMDKLFILNRKVDDFPYVHSSDLIPEWFLCVTRNLPADVQSSIQSALYEMNAGVTEASKMGLLGWKNPGEFADVNVDEFLKIQGSMP